MSIYEKALKALEEFHKTGKTPEKFNASNPEHIELQKQIDALGEEYQEEIDIAQSQLDKLELFERAWDKA